MPAGSTSDEILAVVVLHNNILAVVVLHNKVTNICQSANSVIHGRSQFWHSGLFNHVLPPPSLDYSVVPRPYCAQRQPVCSYQQPVTPSKKHTVLAPELIHSTNGMCDAWTFCRHFQVCELQSAILGKVLYSGEVTNS